MIQFVTQIEAGHRADIGFGGQRIADGQLACGFDKAAGELLDNALLDNQALGRRTDLPGVLVTPDHGRLDGVVEVGIVEHDERIGAAQFQDGLLQHCTGLGADGHAGAHAAGQGDGGDAWVGYRCGNTVRRNVDHLENTFGEACLLERIKQQVGAAHHIRRVLEHVGVAGQQGWNGTAQHLPDREVPRHDRENRPQWAIFDTCLAAFDQGRFGAEHGRAVFGIPCAELRTFFDFTAGLGDRLAHFQGNHAGHGLGVVAQCLAQGKQALHALCHRLAAPDTEPGCSARQGGLQCLGGFERVVADLFTGSRVDRNGVGKAGYVGHGTVLRGGNALRLRCCKFS
ncbi:hypothetical protein D3C76_821760 [compost metagenome]